MNGNGNGYHETLEEDYEGDEFYYETENVQA